ncbi:uncharacterized protein LOC126831957 [Patella vulgata]|uniref:uncharacterized protein LOC126831957 n=1 Tax=Patella vulgata TaxID=6465 RepID=UPI0024A80D88|nr:uncharacterized protein LOC126831957 [Patella vulgata]
MEGPTIMHNILRIRGSNGDITEVPSNSNAGPPQYIVWTHILNPVSLDFSFTAIYTPDVPTTSHPAYIKDFKVGIIGGEVTLKIANDTDAITVPCFINASQDNPIQRIITCRQIFTNLTELSALSNHHDMLEVSFSVSNGGFVVIEDIERNIITKKYLNGSTRTHTFLINVDTSAPVEGRIYDGDVERLEVDKKIDLGKPEIHNKTDRVKPEVDSKTNHEMFSYWKDFYDRESGIKFYQYGFAPKCLDSGNFNIDLNKRKDIIQTTATYASWAAKSDSKYVITVVAYNGALQPSKPVCEYEADTSLFTDWVLISGITVAVVVVIVGVVVIVVVVTWKIKRVKPKEDDPSSVYAGLEMETRAENSVESVYQGLDNSLACQPSSNKPDIIYNNVPTSTVQEASD